MEKTKERKRLRGGTVLGIVVLAAIAIAAGAYFLLENQTCSVANIIEVHGNVNTDNANYEYCMGGVLKYNRDGISFLSEQGEERWNQPCQMGNPFLVSGEHAAIVGDRGGTSIIVLEEAGVKGEIQTTRPIEKMAVSEQGIVAAILKDDEAPMVMCYDAKGNVLVEHRATLGTMGYPIDVSLAPDGKMMLVSYLMIEGNRIGSRVVYYDFREDDTNKKDYQIQEAVYENEVIPTVAFLREDTSVIISDSTLIYYKGETIPEEYMKIPLTGVRAVSYNDSMVVLLMEDVEHSMYKLQIYNLKGELISENHIDKEYTDMKVYNNRVVLYNNDLCCIYTKNGVCKYEGKMEQSIMDIFPMFGINRYIMINASGFYEIRLAK